MRRMLFTIVGSLFFIASGYGQSPAYQSDPLIAKFETDEAVVAVATINADGTNDSVRDDESVVRLTSFDWRWLYIPAAFALGLTIGMYPSQSRPVAKSSASIARPEPRNGKVKESEDRPSEVRTSGSGTLALVARERKISEELREDLAKAQFDLRKAKAEVRELKKQVESSKAVASDVAPRTSKKANNGATCQPVAKRSANGSSRRRTQNCEFAKGL